MRLGQPQLLLDSAGTQGGPTLSPDGRWLAYTSDETGQFEVYVMAFSEGRASAPKRLVSKGGGWSPVWPPGGKQLFYQTLDRRLYVVDYRVTGSSFEAERPQLWFEGQLGDSGFLHSFDVAPDGKRVLSLLSPERPGDATMIRVMLHVDTELRRRSAVAEQSKHK
jgi:serine/threonine-protein kinase